jgi:hypothetical protein
MRTRWSILRTSYCRVEDTFSLKWTRRYRFDFAESMIGAAPNKKGGVIVFASYFHRASEVSNAIKEAAADTGVCLGNCFRGRYRSRAGSIYDRWSMTVSFPVMSKHALVKIATTLARQFGQESVLVMHGATGAVYFVSA